MKLSNVGGEPHGYGTRWIVGRIPVAKPLRKDVVEDRVVYPLGVSNPSI